MYFLPERAPDVSNYKPGNIYYFFQYITKFEANNGKYPTLLTMFITHTSFLFRFLNVSTHNCLNKLNVTAKCSNISRQI